MTYAPIPNAPMQFQSSKVYSIFSIAQLEILDFHLGGVHVMNSSQVCNG